MKKILFLFAFSLCSFGVFASNGLIEVDILKTNIFKKNDISIKNLSEELPNLILIFVKGEGWSSYDDGNPYCITVIRIDGHNVTSIGAAHPQGGNCP